MLGIWNLIFMLPTYFIIFIFGLCVGSFINCLVWRLNQKKTILGRSICPKCKKQIAWYDNVPLLSFILLKGKCRNCKREISWQYPAVELTTSILFVIAFLVNFQFSIPSTLDNFQTIFNWQFSTPSTIMFLRDILFISILIIIFIYDLRWQLILDKITLPAMAVALGLNLWLGMNWINLLLAAGIGGGFFLAQYLVSRGRWIGGGDIRLGVLMGLMLGWPQILVALFLAYVSGSIIGIGLLATGRKQWSSRVPFGAFLSAATIVAMLWGEEMLHWYLKLILF